MITTALIIAGSILSVLAVVVFVLNLVHAPAGNEDETGFHYVREPVVVRSRYYCAKSEATLPSKKAKPFKVHIPAA
jgi:hypothetical protein